MVIDMKKMIKYFVATLVVTSVLATTPMLTNTVSAEEVPVSGVTVGEVANNYLVVNHAIGGGKGATVSVEVDVTFTANAEKLSIGFLPTNQKVDIAQSNISGNGFAESDYLIYWNDGTQFKWSGFKNNTWTQDESISAVQDFMIGNVVLKLTVGGYGIYDMYMKVPSTNTEMKETVQRDEWITLGSGHSVGVFQEYEVPDRNGVNATGYAFFQMENVVYNSVKISPNANLSSVTEYSDDFSSVEKFSANYVTNDAFDAGITTGAIIAPQRDAMDTSNLTKYFYSHDAITFAPTLNTTAFTLADVSMSVSKDGSPVTTGVEGLTFTPAEDGVYDITFSAMNGTATATHQIVVLNMPQQQNINTKFDGEIDAFANKGVTVASGKATLTTNAYFGTKGRAKNFVQMLRITSMESTANEFSVYFGKQTEEVAYSVTFNKGSTQVVVSDEEGVKNVDIGVDVFTCVSGDGLVVQMKKLGNDVEIALTYGNLPMETLNEPVAKFAVTAPLAGQVGVATTSGGLTLDRYVLINYTGEVEIPDAEVEQEKPAPETPSGGDSSGNDNSSNDKNSANDNSSKDKKGCGSVIGATMAVGLLPLAYVTLRKKKD